MEQKCAITGLNYPETEGIKWKQLRPSVQAFLRTVKDDWQDEYFVSYTALNNLLRAYIAELTIQDTKANAELTEHVKNQFEQDSTLVLPVHPDLEHASLSFGQRVADKIADFGGSWTFIIIFLACLIVWMCINVYWLSNKGFDPYPFILLNLILSCVAALQAPVIMMSQNRQEDKDRQRAIK